MTNEEAIAIITEAIEDYVCNHVTDTAKAQKMLNAIQTLEQEPCEDAISRQAVDVLVDELARAISDERCCISRGRSTATIMQNILDLPSVKPQICEDAISRQAVIDAIYDMEILKYRIDLENVIKALPSVNPQEPKTGHWIYKTMEGQFCSICDEQSVWKFNYCPNCGADMRGEQNE